MLNEEEQLNIVLVEDNPDHAEMVMEIFAETVAGSQIRHVWDGEAALKLLTECADAAKRGKSELPHLILLDLRLPRVDGLEVLRQVKEQEVLGRIPIVILTTSDTQRDIDSAYKNRVNSYLVKPVDYDAFTELMRSLGFYWGQCNRAPGEAKAERS